MRFKSSNGTRFLKAPEPPPSYIELDEVADFDGTGPVFTTRMYMLSEDYEGPYYQQIGMITRGGNKMPGLTKEQLDHLFSYHAPRNTDEIDAYVELRDAARVFAQLILARTPSCPDQTVAIRCVREAVMWANSAIANEGKG